MKGKGLIMNENLKVYLLSAILVLSGITLKRLESAGVFNIKNIEKYNAEEVVEDEIRNNSRGDLFSINAAANYEENLVIPIITPTPTPMPTPTPTPTSLTLDMLPIEEIYEFDSSIIDYYYENYGYDQAIEYIMNKYGWTYDEFKTISAIVICEASSDYIDGYWVINTIYNRTIAKNWVASHGTDMYDQAIAPGQFVVYLGSHYRSVINNFESQMNDVAFRGMIDFLITGESVHDYLSFKANGYQGLTNYELSCPNGNKYHNILTPENRVDLVEETSMSR